ncbi:MAG: AIR synthase-related protein [Candidatus Doudnabacteria bacterium]|nr:AIR synthase-related protein [Candidatus Doudnabacteria bacterium]
MHRLFVKYTIPDSRSKVYKKRFDALGLKNKLGAVYLAECYTIDASLNHKQIQAAKNLLANPLAQSADTALAAPRHFNYALEIGYLPGVTDNIGSSAKETLADGAKIKFKDGQNVYFSQIIFVTFNTPTTPPRSSGHLSLKRRGGSTEALKIAASLYNPLIQRAAIKSREEFLRDGGMDLFAPEVKLKGNNKVSLVDLNIADEELIKLGKLGIPNRVIPAKAGILKKDSGSGAGMTHRRGSLALGLDELKVIRDYFNKLGRKPTDIELETLAQTWSEHCKHTIFADPLDELEKGLYKTYIKGATEKIRRQKGRHDFCVSVFTDNAGGISFDKDYIVCHKVETHNTPSALDPFGGSITGIVGVNRDVLGFGLGAKPIANFYGFCLAEPGDKTELYRDKNLTQPMLSARRILDGVVAGINAGGNQSGIPTPLGFLNFDPRYRGKPLVFAGTLGLIPKKIGRQNSWEKQAKRGDLIVMIGGRVGQDGIHGATFASEGLDKDSPATAVQIGDPITQKKFSDAIVKEARGQNLYHSITDCGAGGLSSAVGEMAGQSGGCEVWLEKVPLKYPGLAPWQIWISESQERMVLAVPKNKWQKLEKLMEARGVEASVFGKFTGSGKCIIKYGKNIVLDMDMDFLHNGRPRHKQISSKPRVGTDTIRPLPHKNDYSDQILRLLQSPNLASTEFVSQQYDHEVQASSVLKPLQGRGKINSEAAVIKPLPDSKKALVLAYGLHPAYAELNPYNMAAAGIDTAIRAAVAAGADIDYLALLDNFCWCSPQEPERLWQLKESVRACFDVATAYGTPFISGKDSMYNDFKGFSRDGQPVKISIPPTLLISAVSVVPDAEKTVSLDAKLSGDVIYILGETNDEMGGSEYIETIVNSKIGIPKLPVPSVNSEKNYKLYKALFAANQKNLIASAISVNRGGLIIALIKKLMGGGLGAEINLADFPGNWTENYQALFSESQGRILVSVDPKKAGQFEKLMSENIFAKIGQIIQAPILSIIDKNGKTIADIKISDSLKAYQSTFKEF